MAIRILVQLDDGRAVEMTAEDAMYFFAAIKNDGPKPTQVDPAVITRLEEKWWFEGMEEEPCHYCESCGWQSFNR